ncbi:MAG: type III-B CRISPR-associated protein Cas10/Cmr2 [Bacteroidota bacterium]
MKYVAFTIGPIIATLGKARKTRELWAASYTFSYLMKEITRGLKKRRGLKFILPYVDDPELFDTPESEKWGAGLFPDIFIIRVKDELESLPLVRKQVDKVIRKFASETKEHLNWKQQAEIESYLHRYLQLYSLECELRAEQNPILEITPMLKQLEFQARFIEVEPSISPLFTLINRSTNSFLAKDAFPKTGTKSWKSFPTLIEIATRELKDETATGENTYDELISDLKYKVDGDLESEKDPESKSLLALKQAFPDSFKTYHKYICVVHADGDGIGRLLQRLWKKDRSDAYNLKQLKSFSKKLFEFVKWAVPHIYRSGGEVIYAGGDDLLFFAPVSFRGTSIFHLLDELDQEFKIIMSSAGFYPVPSLSFGLSISYYKFPMFEALEQSRNFLFQKAKKYHPSKNAVAFEVRMHSGQTFSANYQLGSESYQSVLSMLESLELDSTLNSVIAKVQSAGRALATFADNRMAIRHFLDESFNEAIHRDQEPFMEAVKSFLPEAFADAVTVWDYQHQKGNIPHDQFNEKRQAFAIRQAYAGLRILSFLFHQEQDV